MRTLLTGWWVLAELVVLAVFGCQCGDDFGISRVPGQVVASLCDPVTGLPASGQVLWVEAKDGLHEQATNAEGKATLENVPSGDVVVGFKHLMTDGTTLRQDHRQNAVLEERGTLTLVDPACRDFPLQPGRGGIQGQVCNRHTGQLLSGANVTLRGAANELQSTTTDEGGFFMLGDVVAGDYLLTIQSAGFQRSYPVHVESGEITRLDLGSNCRPFDPSNTGNLGGRLCATNGTGPWALAQVTLNLQGGGTLQDLTDEDGRFLIEGIPAGSYTVHVHGGGESASFPATITAGQTTQLTEEQECPVPPRNETGDVRGQICDRATSGWLVGALARTTQNGREILDHTDERGRFHLAGLAPGEIIITIDKESVHKEFRTPIVAGFTVLVVDGQCAPPTGECRTEEKRVEDAVPRRVMLVVDRSGSMSDPGLDGQKWASSVNALKSVTGSLQAEAAFGLALFPSGTSLGGQCQMGDVQVVPAVQNAATIAQELDRTSPGGGTPTGATLLVIREWLQAHPSDTTTVVILATDGVPNCNAGLDPDTCVCAENNCNGDGRACLDDTATLHAIQSIADLGIRTYVIGLPGSGDPTDVLSRMAVAGGTQGYYRPGSTHELTEDITSIVTSNRTCRFELDASPNDPQRVEVYLDNAWVPRDPARRSGWDMVGTRGMELYGTPCRELRSGLGHTVRVRYCVD